MTKYWLAIDKDGTEWRFNEKPFRDKEDIWMVSDEAEIKLLPKGTIKKLIGRDLSWNDDPVEYK